MQRLEGRVHELTTELLALTEEHQGALEALWGSGRDIQEAPARNLTLTLTLTLTLIGRRRPATRPSRVSWTT